MAISNMTNKGYVQFNRNKTNGYQLASVHKYIKFVILFVVQFATIYLTTMFSYAGSEINEFCNGEFSGSYTLKPHLILGEVNRKNYNESKKNLLHLIIYLQ